MGRQKEFDPDKVVEDALKVFWRKGYHDASMKDLFAGTGVNNYGLYSVFGSKHGLFLSAFERYNQEVTKPLVSQISKSETNAQGLRKFLNHASRQLTPGGEPLGCFVCNCMVEVTGTDELAAKLAAKNRKMLTDAFSDFLRSAKPNSPDDENTRKAGLLANGMYTLGLLIRSRSPKNVVDDHIGGLCTII